MFPFLSCSILSYHRIKGLARARVKKVLKYATITNDDEILMEGER
jgi:hypothetical protein